MRGHSGHFGPSVSIEAGTRVTTTAPPAGRIGDSPLRPDGTLKVTGEFAYASDLWHDEMCWGVTLRSPHPHARIRGIDITDALTVPGVWAVLTADDVPGENAFGLEHADQPVLASEFVRYEGEPVALVAAHDLLARVPAPSDLEIREALAGNLCRCTGYEKIMDAVRTAAEVQR